MEEIFTFIENLSKRLSRSIKDLDDVRGSMAALSEIREAEIRSVFFKFLLYVPSTVLSMSRSSFSINLRSLLLDGFMFF